MRSRLLVRVLTALAAVLIAAPAVAYDATKAPRYASPDMYRPNVDRIIINGPGSTGPIDGMWTTAPVPGGVTRALTNRFLDLGLSPQDFGAICDGLADDTVALQKWLAAGTTQKLVLLKGTCTFNTPLVAAFSRPRIQGAGRNLSTLLYTGASTTADLLTFGDGTNSYTGLDVNGFRVRSSTVMTAGAGIRIRRFQGGSNKLLDVSAGPGISGDRNLKTGVWFDNINVVTYRGFDVGASGDAIRVNGRDTVPPDSANIDEGSDLWLDDGTITFSGTGVHVGGGFGGLYSESVLYLGNNSHVIVDNAIANNRNRELVFTTQTVFDISKDYGLYINDPKAGGSVINFDAFAGSAGRYGSGGVGEEIHVEKWPGSFISIGSPRISNAISHGLAVNDNTTTITISDRTGIAYNGGYGIAAGTQTQAISGSPSLYQNTLGDRQSTVQNPARPTYTPTITPQQGTFGSLTLNTANYRRTFGGCQVDIDFTINTAGSAVYGIYVTLPFTVRGNALFSGKLLNSPYTSFTLLQQGGSTLYVTKDDGTSLSADGNHIHIAGSVDCL